MPPRFFRPRALALLPILLLAAVMGGHPLAGSEPPVFTPEKQYLLWDNKPAPLDLKGWEFQSYPLGNAHFGVSFFGGISEELFQFCEKSLYVLDPAADQKRYDRASLSSLCEIRLLQDHRPEQATGYRREVNLNKAEGSVRYSIDGVDYTRESLASYPDNCFVTRLTASKPGKVSFRLKALHAYLNSSRLAKATTQGNVLILDAETKPYGLNYQVRVAVKTKGGTLHASTAGAEGELAVEGADSAEIFVTLGTNYRLDPKVFLNPDEKKLEGLQVPAQEIDHRLSNAVTAGWEGLKKRHEEDYTRLFQRTQIDLGGKESGIPTGELLSSTNLPAPAARYLEELYFQFGRYLLISSSRPGTLPANLQGTWNMNIKAPWTGGYWANINIQMNYWPAFSTGLEETFGPYYDFFHATFPKEQQIAAQTLASWKCKPAEGGWTAGTGNDSFRCSGPGPTSGAGTGPFVILPMWEWYQYTGNREVLEKAWPFLLASSKFLVSALKEQPDGTLLCDPSWSPENKSLGTNGTLINMPGTAYDQELVYENHRITLEAAKILGKTDPILPVLQAQMPKLSPVLIGTSGQIKEFRQENAYAEFGDPHHRHISHLIGLFPGTLLTEKKEWMDAARVSLNLRGDKSTGWAMAHRLNAWTRLKDGPRCYTLLMNLLHKGTMPNLWDTHPPFQIDGNFGGTAGIANMLLQSHEGFIDLLPALPPEWAAGSFSGIRARGAFSVSAEWSEMKIRKVLVVSSLGSPCAIRINKSSPPTRWKVTDSEGAEVPSSTDPATGVLKFGTAPGRWYLVTPL
jgi:alpha-L-fucosidase 2